MTTKIEELRVLYEDPAPAQGTSFSRSIRTADRNLMTSRLRSMLSSYGERVIVPNSLVLEIIRNRDKLSRRLKVAQRKLGELDEYADDLELCLDEALLALSAVLDGASDLMTALHEHADSALFEKISKEYDDLVSVMADASDLVVVDCGDCEENIAD